jgi:hypothetical protein
MHELEGNLIEPTLCPLQLRCHLRYALAKFSVLDPELSRLVVGVHDDVAFGSSLPCDEPVYAS